ncbi:MAG TPA: hypothetical protein VJ765_01315 [Chitinophagaceae bacterium]|nr:hypothetical protein [Chitinophagaceae bacterium]
MEINIKSITTADLINLYQKTDAVIKKELLNGVLWNELKDKINLLTELSKELTKRHVSIRSLENANSK